MLKCEVLKRAGEEMGLVCITSQITGTAVSTLNTAYSYHHQTSPSEKHLDAPSKTYHLLPGRKIKLQGLGGRAGVSKLSPYLILVSVTEHFCVIFLLWPENPFAGCKLFSSLAGTLPQIENYHSGLVQLWVLGSSYVTNWPQRVPHNLHVNYPP